MTETSRAIWRPIEELGTVATALASTELAALAPIWRARRAELEGHRALADFNARLRRQWAIETGVIEGLYSIDRGTTELLIERGLELSLIEHGATDRPPALVLDIVNDQAEVLDRLFEVVRGDRPLSTSFIKELHALFTRHQETSEAIDALGRRVEVKLLRGEWKQLPNNPRRAGEISLYCPPEHVASEMDRLVLLEAAMTETSPELRAAWLHHRLTQIHPFQDGNGRVARALASLVFIRAGWFPLTVTRDQRTRYIAALEKADDGDLGALVDFFTGVQKSTFLQALKLSTDAPDERATVRQVMDAAVDRLRDRLAGKSPDVQPALALADELIDMAKRRLAIVADELSVAFRGIDPTYAAFVMDDAGRQGWYKADVIELADRLGYFADMRSLHRWVRLTIREARSAELVICLHAIGRDFVGVVGSSAFLKYREAGEDGERVVEGPLPLADEVFQFAYNEAEGVVRSRFERWLEACIVSGIETWRRGL